MKTIRVLFLAAAALLPLSLNAATASVDAATPPRLAMWQQQFRFKPMEAGKQQQLRHACAACAAVELELHQNGPQGGLLWSRRLSRGEALDAVLARLAAVPQWYEGACRIQTRIPSGYQAQLRFVDAAGRELLELRAVSGNGLDWGTLYLALSGQGPARNLVDYFPFPPRPWGKSMVPERVSFIITDEAELRRIDPAYDRHLPAVAGGEGCSLCRVSDKLLVLARHGGSGLYVTRLRVYQRPAGKGDWVLHPTPFGHSTGAAANTPKSCGMDKEGKLMTIYDRDGNILHRLDLSLYLK